MNAREVISPELKHLRHHNFYWLQEFCEARGKNSSLPLGQVAGIEKAMRHRHMAHKSMK